MVVSFLKAGLETACRCMGVGGMSPPQNEKRVLRRPTALCVVPAWSAGPGPPCTGAVGPRVAGLELGPQCFRFRPVEPTPPGQLIRKYPQHDRRKSCNMKCVCFSFVSASSCVSVE